MTLSGTAAPDELYNEADRITRALVGLPGVGNVSMAGGLQKQLAITVDKAAMEFHGVSVPTLLATLHDQGLRLFVAGVAVTLLPLCAGAALGLRPGNVPGAQLAASIAAGSREVQLKGQAGVLCALARLDPARLTIAAQLDAPAKALTLVVGSVTAYLPLADLVDGKAWLVWEYGGQPLPREHGGPCRMITPKLYAWEIAPLVKAAVVRAVKVMVTRWFGRSSPPPRFAPCRFALRRENRE